MRSLIFSILLVFLAVQADAFVVQGRHKPSATCSTPTTGNLFNEGFEDTGYDSGKTVAESGTVNEDASRPGTQSPTGLCSQSLLVDAATGAHYSRIDEGTARDEVYVRFYFYVTSGYEASKTPTIFDGTQNATQFERGFEVKFDSYGGPYIKGVGATTSSNISVSANTWNYVDVHFVRNGSSTISANGGATQTFTARDYPVRYYNVGKVIVSTSFSGNIYFDISSASTSAM